MTPDDVKAIAPDVLRHRVLTTYEAEAEEVTSDQIVQRILGKIESPERRRRAQWPFGRVRAAWHDRVIAESQREAARIDAHARRAGRRAVR